MIVNPFSEAMHPLPRQVTEVVSSSTPTDDDTPPPRSTGGDMVNPAVCFDLCNNAYREYQRLSHVLEQLCAPDSEFTTLCMQCLSCIEIQGIGHEVYNPLQEAFESCNAAATSGVHYTISTSWLTKSTTLSVITIPSITDGSITVSQVYTVVLQTLVTRFDWTGFDQSTTATPPINLTTGAGGIVTSDSASGDSSGSGGNQAWIAGPVIGGVAGLAILVGIYLFFARRRKRSPNSEDMWTGKPELHAESVPGPPKTLLEVDAESRPPQELEGDYYVPADQRTHWEAAEMAANEVAAREMDVKSPGQELEVQSPSRPLAGNI